MRAGALGWVSVIPPDTVTRKVVSCLFITFHITNVVVGFIFHFNCFLLTLSSQTVFFPRGAFSPEMPQHFSVRLTLLCHYCFLHRCCCCCCCFFCIREVIQFDHLLWLHGLNAICTPHCTLGRSLSPHRRSLSWHPGAGLTLQQNPWPAAAAGWTAAAPTQVAPFPWVRSIWTCVP